MELLDEAEENMDAAPDHVEPAALSPPPPPPADEGDVEAPPRPPPPPPRCILSLSLFEKERDKLIVMRSLEHHT